jgi:hypothetical protein
LNKDPLKLLEVTGKLGNIDANDFNPKNWPELISLISKN